MRFDILKWRYIFSSIKTLIKEMTMDILRTSSGGGESEDSWLWQSAVAGGGERDHEFCAERRIETYKEWVQNNRHGGTETADRYADHGSESLRPFCVQACEAGPRSRGNDRNHGSSISAVLWSYGMAAAVWPHGAMRTSGGDAADPRHCQEQGSAGGW